MFSVTFEILDRVLLTIGFIIVCAISISYMATQLKARKQDRTLKQDELSWRKTQFVFELAHMLASDREHKVAHQIIEFGIGLPQNSTLARILLFNQEELDKEEIELRYVLDRYLDFFDRLYHFTFNTHSLKLPDLEIFGWYIGIIGETPAVRMYAERQGYDGVLILYNEFCKFFENRVWFKTFLANQQSKHNLDIDVSLS